MKARLTGINMEEVSSYLGSESNEILPEIKDKIFEYSNPMITYTIFDINDTYINQNILIGKDVTTLLKDCERVVLFGATLGAGIDTYLSRLQIVDMAKAVIFDAYASGAIENICDNFCEDIQNEYGFITDRFSPGYGDLAIDIQNNFAKVLKLQKNIGVSLTESGLLVPQKSVTAIFGIADKPQKNSFRGCKKCKLYSVCSFRKENKPCER